MAKAKTTKPSDTEQAKTLPPVIKKADPAPEAAADKPEPAAVARR